MNIEKIDKEVQLIVNLERNELEAFRNLSKKALKEIEDTKEEKKIEDEIDLNIKFVHHRLKNIQAIAEEMLRLDKEVKKGNEDAYIDLQLQLKSILMHLFELENEFFPVLATNLQVLEKEQEKNTRITKVMKSRIEYYQSLVEKLKDSFDLKNVKVTDWKKLNKIKTRMVHARFA